MGFLSTSDPDTRIKAQALCEQAWQQFGSGDRMAAMSSCREALDLEGDCAAAHVLLSTIALDGVGYFSMLKDIHQHLQPRTYLEIGVDKGESIVLANKDTIAIGVDPEPQISSELSASVRIFRESSDEFFAGQHLVEALGGKPLDLAFIDGKHHFEYALRDFVNIERNSHPATTVLIHDCYPLDELTSAREQVTTFWSGDVWKLVVCLKKYRPDLKIHTLAVPWTGLGVVRGLDRNSTVLPAQLDRLYGEFISLPYSMLAVNKSAALNLVPGNWGNAQKLLM